MDNGSPPFLLYNFLISIIMATALATTAAPVQFDFQNNNVEVMTLDTLRRTHKEMTSMATRSRESTITR